MTNKEKYLKLLEAHQDALAKFNKAQIKMSLEIGFMNKQSIDEVSKAFKEVQTAFKSAMDFMQRFAASGETIDSEFNAKYHPGEE